MDSRTALTSWDEQGIACYVDARRQALDQFLRNSYSFRGTIRVLRRTLRADLLRHPLNFVLSIPKLFISRIANFLEKLGWYSTARALQTVFRVLRSGFEAARERQIVTELIAVSGEPDIRSALEPPLSHFMAARESILELANGGLTLALAYLLFGSAGLSPYEMGRRLASNSAHEQAASRFALGRGLGSAFYHLFPVEPTWGQVAIWSVLVLALLGTLTTSMGLLSDPLQQALGVHRRQLSRLLDAFEDNLLLQAARRPGGLQPVARSRSRGSAAAQRRNPRPRRKRRIELGSQIQEVARLPKRFFQKLWAFASRVHARLGRRNSWLAGLAGVSLFVVAGVLIQRQRDPYTQVRALIEQHAYVTAIARLDRITGKESKQNGEYWYWRGRALCGNRQLDGAIEAYHSAISRDARFGSDRTLVRDAIDAVASKNHERAKRLLLEDVGPPAIARLRERALSREDIHRWSLVELIKKLGGEDQLDYRAVAQADLAGAASCPAKKRAVEKVVEFRAADAVPALRDLDGQPQYKCLQSTLKHALATLEAAEAKN
jgi:tetratricopeptide (TPR) repeat protein